MKAKTLLCLNCSVAEPNTADESSDEDDEADMNAGKCQSLVQPCQNVL